MRKALIALVVTACFGMIGCIQQNAAGRASGGAADSPFVVRDSYTAKGFYSEFPMRVDDKMNACGFRQQETRFSIDTGKREAYYFVYDESGKAVVKLYLTPSGDKETSVTAYTARDTPETARMLEIAKYAANRTPGCPAQK